MTIIIERYLDLLIFFTMIIIAFMVAIIYQNYIGKRRTAVLLEMLVGIIEIDNPNLEGHSLYVHNLTMALYEFMPYRYKIRVRESDLHYAALLLDIGKLGIPDSIMERAGKLGKNDWEIIKKHPDLGVEMLRDVPGMGRTLDYILYHHERVDGRGYHQLSGKDIPLGARMIAVADTYSAMTMNRSYKASMSYPEAVSELRMAAGSQLDAELVNIFCNIPVSKIESCRDDVRIKLQKIPEDRKGSVEV